MLLIAQCNALHRAMPFLFESIDDETELLLPDHLLHSDSLVRNLVGEIPEEDWQEVELIGWLYQFYISEKKDEVIGKVVKSEDIPAATQLFTPNWIVKYLVQNSLGRQWVATYPNSPLVGQMEYYIEPAEQTAEVQAKLAEITPDRLNPEELTLLDPACGSGHILVEAYDLLKAIYQERGYRAKDIPRLILEKNLFGLEIDDRAAQLAAFALTMKARADDRGIFDRDAQPQVLSIQESKGLDAQEITDALNHPLEGGDGSVGKIEQPDIVRLLDLFEHGKTFGSLICIPQELAARLPAITERVQQVSKHGGMFGESEVSTIGTIIAQGGILGRRYGSVVTNPPYMNRKYYCSLVDTYLGSGFEEYTEDLFAAFIGRCVALTQAAGNTAMITMDSWMFGDDFNDARQSINDSTSVVTLAHLGPRAFDEISGEVVQVCAFVLVPVVAPSHVGAYFRLVAPRPSEEKRRLFLQGTTRFDVEKSFFDAFPRNLMAYFATRGTQEAFPSGTDFQEFAEARTGLQTGDNPRFIRFWSEVDYATIDFSASPETAARSPHRWFPYVKGSEFRKWYGNLTFVVDWHKNGQAIREHPRSTVRNSDCYFRPGLAYNNIAKTFSARLIRGGAMFDQKNSMFCASSERFLLGTLGFLHSPIVAPLLEVVAPKDFNPGCLKVIPVRDGVLESPDLDAAVSALVQIAERDWNRHELSWDFGCVPWVNCEAGSSLQDTYQSWATECEVDVSRTKELEESVNTHLLQGYGLIDEFAPEVGDDQITLDRPNRKEDIKQLIAYSIGCMMGRYSLDKPGLIYAHSGNEGFDPAKYQKFPADDDGIVPLTEFHWFEDDAAKRLEKFIATAWPGEVKSEKWEVGSGK